MIDSHGPSSWRTATLSVDGVADGLRNSVRETARSVGSIRIPEFVLFAMIVLSPMFFLSATFKVDTVFVALVCGLAVMRRARYSLGSYELFIPFLAVAMLYLGIVSVTFAGTDVVATWYTRLARMMTVIIFVFVTATGRIDLRSGALGYLAALIVNVPLFYAGLTTNNYPPYLTGALGDKNVAGLAYALGLVMVPLVVKRRDHSLALMVLLAGALWLTGSRTSLAGAGIGLAWMVLAPRLNLAGKAGFLGLAVWVLKIVEEDFSRIGVFSDRTGSDLLRARIDAASLQKVHETGFFGQGLGEAFTYVGEKAWFFHNSYWTMLVEGGWPWTILVVTFTIVVMIPAWRQGLTRDQYLSQGMGAVFLMCSTRLGEVMLTTFWGIAMALALHTYVSSTRLVDDAPEIESRISRSGA